MVEKEKQERFTQRRGSTGIHWEAGDLVALWTGHISPFVLATACEYYAKG